MQRSLPTRLLRNLLAPATLTLLLAANGCSDAGTAGSVEGAAPPTRPSGGATPGEVASANVSPVVSAVPSAQPGVSADVGKFADLVTTLSEPNGEFISDNLISNETSYLQVADELAARAAGGVYLGVGPEQNFSYIALTRPSLAFIVDIRRGNLLQHLYFKALFDEAASRAHFVALLLGRPYEAAGDPGAGADLEAVIAHAERRPPEEKTLAETLKRVLERVEQGYGVPLDADDRKNVELVARRFHERQLGIRFELKETSGRRYPTLRELLLQGDPAGARRGFLASEEAFRFVQRMQREHRIIPVVGDFAGDRAMPALASLLRDKHLTVSAFYVSNVEQYLLEPKIWEKWMRNVAALPTDGSSVFIRAYLDQGRRHPKQMQGHRTATVLQKVADFSAHQEKNRYRSFWAIATDGFL